MHLEGAWDLNSDHTPILLMISDLNEKISQYLSIDLQIAKASKSFWKKTSTSQFHYKRQNK